VPTSVAISTSSAAAISPNTCGADTVGCLRACMPEIFVKSGLSIPKTCFDMRRGCTWILSKEKHTSTDCNKAKPRSSSQEQHLGAVGVGRQRRPMHSSTRTLLGWQLGNERTHALTAIVNVTSVAITEGGVTLCGRTGSTRPMTIVAFGHLCSRTTIVHLQSAYQESGCPCVGLTAILSFSRRHRTGSRTLLMPVPVSRREADPSSFRNRAILVLRTDRRGCAANVRAGNCIATYGLG